MLRLSNEVARLLQYAKLISASMRLQHPRPAGAKAPSHHEFVIERSGNIHDFVIAFAICSWYNWRILQLHEADYENLDHVTR